MGKNNQKITKTVKIELIYHDQTQPIFVSPNDKISVLQSIVTEKFQIPSQRQEYFNFTGEKALNLETDVIAHFSQILVKKSKKLMKIFVIFFNKKNEKENEFTFRFKPNSTIQMLKEKIQQENERKTTSVDEWGVYELVNFTFLLENDEILMNKRHYIVKETISARKPKKKRAMKGVFSFFFGFVCLWKKKFDL
jgi:hypothetical protein